MTRPVPMLVLTALAMLAVLALIAVVFAYGAPGLLLFVFGAICGLLR